MKNLEKEIKKNLDQLLDKKYFTYFLFGSRTKNNFRYNSDYDIWIWAPKKIDLNIILKVRRILKENIDRPIDIVDFTRVDKEFKNLALKNIKLWNKGKDWKRLLIN